MQQNNSTFNFRQQLGMTPPQQLPFGGFNQQTVTSFGLPQQPIRMMTPAPIQTKVPINYSTPVGK